jgi:hypothetical protein
VILRFAGGAADRVPERVVAGGSQRFGQATHDPRQCRVGAGVADMPQNRLAIASALGRQLGRQRGFAAAWQPPDMRDSLGL